MISDRPKPFIFIHIPKTAGTSIEKALLPSSTGYADFKYVPVDQRRQHHLPCPGISMQHQKLRRYQHVLEKKPYFVFSVVRNPFSRVISQISYLEAITSEGRNLFAGDWKTKLMVMAQAQKWIAGHDLGANQVDYLEPPPGLSPSVFTARFESLGQVWPEICQRLGLITQVTLPHIFIRRNQEPYQSYYDGESREAIGHKYERDLTAFSYGFDD